MAMKEQKKPVGNGKAECRCGEPAERAVSEAASEAALESEEAAAEMMSEEQSLAIAELETKLGEAEAAAEKNRDLYIHAVADLDNYRRKAQSQLQCTAAQRVPLLAHLRQTGNRLDRRKHERIDGIGVQMGRKNAFRPESIPNSLSACGISCGEQEQLPAIHRMKPQNIALLNESNNP